MRRIAATLAFVALLGLVTLGTASCGGNDDDGGTLLKVVLHHGNNSRPYMPLPEEVAKQIKGALAPVGIDVEIRKVEWAPYLDMVQNGEHQMALLGWSADVPDPDNFLYVLLHKDNARPGSANNISFYTSDEVSGKLSEARLIGDQARREQLYREAQQIIFDDVPMVPLVYTDRIIAHRKEFGEIGIEPVTHPVLRRISQPKPSVPRERTNASMLRTSAVIGCCRAGAGNTAACRRISSLSRRSCCVQRSGPGRSVRTIHAPAGGWTLAAAPSMARRCESAP